MTAVQLTPRPGLASRVGTGLMIVLAGGLVGIVSVGIVSRLAMFLLIELNPDVGGRTTDDGFEMGRFTLSGSLNLALVGVFLGVLSGFFYLALERLRFGPAWFRTLSLGVGAGVVAATQVVHSDGVDFTLLEPLALAVALFVAIPVLHVALLDVTVVRIRGARGGPVASATGVLSWALRAALVVIFVLAVASLVGDVRALTD